MKYIEALDGNVFDILKQACKETKLRAYVVGGYVRDYMLNIPNDDIDVVVEGSGIEFARYISDNLTHTKLQYYENYGTAMVTIDGMDVEFVGARKEMYERGSRKPIVEEGTLRDDQLRRDFTINAMAFSLNEDDFGELIDPFNGMEDLKNGIIRTPQDPDITFSDDPLRMFRAVRFATKLTDENRTFVIEETTKKGIIHNLHRTKILSMERIVGELDKMMNYPNSSYGFNLLMELELNFHIIENLDLYFNRFSKVIEKITELGKKQEWEDLNEWQWVTFIYMTQGNFMGLMTSGEAYKENYKSFKLPSSYYKLYSDFMEGVYLIRHISGYSDYKKLRRIPYIFGKNWKHFMLIYELIFKENNIHILMKEIENYEDFVDWTCPIDGYDIMKFFNIEEGKALGIIKKKLEMNILNGITENTVEGAYGYLRYVKYSTIKSNE